MLRRLNRSCNRSISLAICCPESLKAAILTLIGIVISHNSLKRVFLGERLGPERMFEAYAAFTVYERVAPEEPVICQQPFDRSSHGIGTE
jgi:hypothetical protein